jgi:hypothetical protein
MPTPQKGDWMRVSFSWIAVVLFAGTGVPALPGCALAQDLDSALVAVNELPEAPQPQIAVEAVEPQAPAGQSKTTAKPAPSATSAQAGAAQGSSSSQTGIQQSEKEKSQYEKAKEQIKEEEHQRVLGIIPYFNTTYRSDAVSMTPGQKMDLAFHSSVDPFTFAAGFMVAGYHEALDQNKGFGWGLEGYGKRSGAAYLDAVNGTMIGNGILPIIFHQDPRYFRLGYGPTRHRLFYAVATSYICKHDNTGKWEPNYSNVGGNIIAGAISNLYYPPSGSGVGQTFANGFIVTTEGTIGGVFQEFWPDVSRKLFHKDPTHGLDAKARAAYKAKKDAQQQQK